ncbi:MAG: hypothetical protein V5B34_15025 [Accumulibacter sp.]|jgi:hypothetical protein
MTTNTTQTTPKQTAGNNTFLANAKRGWNVKIFKRVSTIMNTEGRAAAIAYLQQYTTEKLGEDYNGE